MKYGSDGSIAKERSCAGGPSDLRDRAGERREVACVASRCAHELGAAARASRTAQLVIVKPHAKSSTPRIIAPCAAAFAPIGFCHARRIRCGCRCRGGITPRSMTCSTSSSPSSASACRHGRSAPATRWSSIERGVRVAVEAVAQQRRVPRLLHGAQGDRRPGATAGIGHGDRQARDPACRARPHRPRLGRPRDRPCAGRLARPAGGRSPRRPAPRRRRARTRDRHRRARRSRLGRGSPRDQRRAARSDLVRGRHRADRRPAPGQRSRTTGMVGIRHGGTDQGQLAPARGRLRLPLTRATPAPTGGRTTRAAPDSQLATARRAAAHSVVGQLAKPDRDQSLPPGVGQPALLKPRPTEPRPPLRRPQRGVPGGALETRRPGCRRRRSGRSMGHRGGSLQRPAAHSTPLRALTPTDRKVTVAACGCAAAARPRWPVSSRN